MKQLIFIYLLFYSFILTADEGQWLPRQLPKIEQQLNAIGIEIPAQQLANLTQAPLSSVVSLGYCSGGFISKTGLIITNHHCAYSAIQHNSRVNNNLLEQGFLAKNLLSELPAGPQERLYITESMQDVTAQVFSGIKSGIKGKAYFDAIQGQRKQLIKACEQHENYRCRVQSFHHGHQYFLIKQRMIRDVRLVYAPPLALGNFGGDIDNFEYPRHTADFALLRAYVGPKGNSLSYAENNEPYLPSSFFTINSQGVVAGDPILLAGYPGSTSRYRLPVEVAFSEQWLYPQQIKLYELTLAFLAQKIAKQASLDILYSAQIKGINNRLKKRYGLLDGFQANHILEKKKYFESQWQVWLKSQPQSDRQQQNYQQLIALLQEQHQLVQQKIQLNMLLSSKQLQAALTLYRLSLEHEKPDIEREQGYQARDEIIIQARQERLQNQFDAETDLALWQHHLAYYLQLPKTEQSITLVNFIQPLQTHHFLEQLQKTQMMHLAFRLSLLKKPLSWFEQAQDPMLKLAVKLYPLIKDLDNKEKALKGAINELRPQYMHSIITYQQQQGLTTYPDANRSLRVTFGRVDGYSPQDGLYKVPFTRLSGLLAKDKQQYPFFIPKKLRSAALLRQQSPYWKKNLDPKNYSASQLQQFDDIPVNFLSSADTTGGNSGSPVLDSQGNLIGINFDSSYESISKDWYYNPEITRAIHVDIRFILWVLDEVEQAQWLLDEIVVQ